MPKLSVISTFAPEKMEKFSVNLFAELEKRDISCHKPKISSNPDEQALSKEEIFNNLVKEISKATRVLFIAHDETADWGAMLGLVYALKKDIIILSEQDNLIPFMAARMSEKVLFVDNFEKVGEYAERLAELVKKKAKKRKI